MEKIETTQTKTYTTISYKAVDGTMFECSQECENYEKTAKCLLKTKYNKYKVRTCNEYELFGAGDEYYNVDIVKISDENIIDYIIQLWLLYYPICTREERSGQVNTLLNKLKEAQKANDYFFINRGRNDDEDFYPTQSRLERTLKIQGLCEEETK